MGVGFFISIFFAWAFELTPEGVKREKDVDRSQSITPQTGKKLNNTILMMMALAIGYLLYDKFSPGNGSEPFSQEPTAQVIEAGNEKRDSTPAEAEPAINRQSIAVLPFENRSNREEDQFFTDGIHDDLLTTIAKIGSMKVISRTSVMEYKGTTKKIPEIAKELGVANILEGGIQRSGNQVRINVQLIDAETDEHLWAEIFDRELTAENLFAIQSEISQSIAAALQATLSPEETARINTVPTQNLQAYDAYLRGRQLMASRQSAELEQSIEAFNKAVDLDPEFALAWVGVADSHNLLAVYGSLNQELANSIREDAIKRALTIDDKLGEAYASLGSLYDQANRPIDAEEAFQKAIELSPNYATAWHWYANFLTSFPLRSGQTLELTRKAVELDPRSMIIGSMLGGAYANQGLYSLAERQFQKLTELHPDFGQGYGSLARLYTFSTGEFDKAILMNRKAIELDPGNSNTLLIQALIYIQLGDITSAEAVSTRMEEIDAEHWGLGWTDVMVARGKNNPAATSEAINWVLPKLQNIPNFAQFAAVMALSFGDKERAREIFLGANPGWLEPDQWQGLIEQYAFEACVFSWVLSNTGDEPLGSRLLQQATQYFDVELAAVNEHVDNYSPDICYLVSGDKEKALDTIETQLAHNHLFGWNMNHQLPMYDLIRFEPRYQAAFAERERRIAAQLEVLAKIDAEAGP